MAIKKAKEQRVEKPVFTNDELAFIALVSGKIAIPPERPEYNIQATVRKKVFDYLREIKYQTTK